MLYAYRASVNEEKRREKSWHETLYIKLWHLIPKITPHMYYRHIIAPAQNITHERENIASSISSAAKRNENVIVTVWRRKPGIAASLAWQSSSRINHRAKPSRDEGKHNIRNASNLRRGGKRRAAALPALASARSSGREERKHAALCTAVFAPRALACHRLACRQRRREASAAAEGGCRAWRHL